MNKKMPTMRSHCPLSCGLDVIGDKWSLLILRDLMMTNRTEFGHLLNAGEGISTNILSERLAKMQRNGLVNKSPHPEHGKKFVYSLTDKGLGLAPVIIELARWAYTHIDEAIMPASMQKRIAEDTDGLVQQLQKGEPLFNLDL